MTKPVRVPPDVLLPDELFVDVGIDDIACGIPGLASVCALARALHRVPGVQSVKVGQMRVLIYDGPNPPAMYALDKAGQNFVVCFDKRPSRTKPARLRLTRVE